jgi:hypothetical protein
MKGVSYRVGNMRGKMVETGRSWAIEDTGTLSVTSHRLLFTGTTRTVECLYAKLVDLDVYADAIGVHVSNRQRTTMVRVPDAQAVVALVNVAVQRLD